MSATPVIRLGYLVPEFPSLTHIFFWREAQALRALGVDLTWISTRRPSTACPHAFGAWAAAETHYVYPPRPATALASLLRSPLGGARSLRYLASLRESSLAERARGLGLLACAADLAEFARRRSLDHLHVHSCAEAAHLAALAERLSGLPYSLTLHGDLPVYGHDHHAKMERATFVSVVTRDLHQQVARFVGLPPNRLPVVRMGIDSDFFTPGDRALPTEGAFHFVTVARLGESKGHRFALGALRALVDGGVDAAYTIAGSGPDRALIEAEIARLGLSGRVTMAGSLDEGQVRDLLRSADAFVLPSVGLGEAAPVAVMEAMATALPVVCSIIGGIPELVTDGQEGFLVPQEDSAGLAGALRRLATDRDQRLGMGRAARRRAAAEFGAGRCAAALLDRIMASRSGTAPRDAARAA